MTTTKSFEQAWAETGRQYGPEELEGVRLGWDLRGQADANVEQMYTRAQVEEALIKVLSTCCLFEGDSDETRRQILAALTRLPRSACRHLGSSSNADLRRFYEEPCRACGLYYID